LNSSGTSQKSRCPRYMLHTWLTRLSRSDGALAVIAWTRIVLHVSFSFKTFPNVCQKLFFHETLPVRATSGIQVIFFFRDSIFYYLSVRYSLFYNYCFESTQNGFHQNVSPKHYFVHANVSLGNTRRVFSPESTKLIAIIPFKKYRPRKTI